MKADDDISKRKGKVVFSREDMMNYNERFLREIFSNFFPIAIEPNHNINFYESIIYYGLSPHFDEIELNVEIPTYHILMNISDEGVVKFDKMERL